MGKTTHAKLLVEKLRETGLKAQYVKYPVYDIEPSGSFINDVLRNPDGQKISEKELQMWFVVNRFQYEAELKRLLDDDYHVVAEDYAGTGKAWGHAKGVSLEWLEEINSPLLQEDLAIVIEGDRAMDAVEDVHVHEQNPELIKKCATVHSLLADRYNWRRVHFAEKKEDTADAIWQIVVDDLGIKI